MSLAIIEDTLTMSEMEEIMAGSGCGWAALGLGLTFASALFITGPIGAGIFAAKFIHGSISLARSCSWSMSFLKKYRKQVLTIVLYYALFRIGQELYELLTYGLNPQENSYIELSGLIGDSFLAVGCFWELYFPKN